MKDATDTGRVKIWDLDQTGAGGAFRRRAASEDWAEALAHRKQPPYGLRLEWPHAGTEQHDWLDPTAPEPDPPPWVDVITTMEGGGAVRVRLTATDEGPRPVGFEVRADAEITSRVLRRVALGSILDEIDRLLSEGFAVGRVLGSAWRRHVTRPGRAGRPDAFYAERALRYVRAIEVEPRRPIAYLIEQAAAEGERTTAAQWRAWLNRARERGLLSRAPSGKAGGALSDEARQQLSIIRKLGGRR